MDQPPQDPRPPQPPQEPLLPPQQNWAQPPQQQQYAQYYRGPSGAPGFYGSWQQLQALADGYFGLNWAFAANIGLIILLWITVFAAAQASPGASGIVYLLGLPVLAVAVGFITYPHNKKIAVGKGWANSSAVIASILMALNSFLCCGLIGYIVMQQIAGAEMKLYGIKTGFFGLQKRNVKAAIEAMKMQQQQGPMSPPIYPAPPA